MGRNVKVKNYPTARELEKDTKSMLSAGWKMESATGMASKKPWATRNFFGWGDSKITVVWVKQ